MKLNYTQFNLALGDANFPCAGAQINASDVSLTVDSLISNVNKKAAQVHAYSSYKEYVSASKLFYSIDFRIPYQPSPNIDQRLNPQTIEVETAIWHGDVKKKYNVGIQWIINPWIQQSVNVWRNNAWVPVLNVNIIQNQLYRFISTLDLSDPNGNTVELIVCQEGVHEPIGQWQSYSEESHPEWGNDFSWWVSAENISAWPNCSLGIGFVHENNWYKPNVVVNPRMI